MESTNPEQAVQVQQIVAKVLYNGDPNTQESQYYEITTFEDLKKQKENSLFSSLFLDVENDKGTVWIDVREKCSTISKEQSETLVNFIRQFNDNHVIHAKAFKNYKEFKNFLPIIG